MGFSSLRSEGSDDSQAGRLDCISIGQRQTRGTTGIESTQIRWLSHSQAGEAGLREKWPKTLK
jgi:hypothetical protein